MVIVMAEDATAPGLMTTSDAVPRETRLEAGIATGSKLWRKWQPG